jgi:hypothetical protein
MVVRKFGSTSPRTPRGQDPSWGGDLDPVVEPRVDTERALRTLAFQAARSEAYLAGQKVPSSIHWSEDELVLLGGDYIAGARRARLAPPVREYSQPKSEERGSASEVGAAFLGIPRGAQPQTGAQTREASQEQEQASTAQPSGTQCDEYGNVVKGKARYILLRSKAPWKCGLYYCTWEEFRSYAPNSTLPQEGYWYKKPATFAAAVEAWTGKGHPGNPPVRHGDPTPGDGPFGPA